MIEQATDSNDKAELLRVPGSDSAHNVRWRGEVRTLQGWAEHLGVKYNRLYTRYFRYGWDLTYVMETATDPRPKGVSMDQLKTPEAIQKSAETRKGQKRNSEPESDPNVFRVNADINPMVWADRQGKNRVGKKHSDETIEKMKASRQNLKARPETADKTRKTLKQYTNPRLSKSHIESIKRSNKITQRMKYSGADFGEQ